MKPEQIEDEIEYLLLECGNTWFGGQRQIIRFAMRKLAYRVLAAQPVVIGQTHRQTLVEVLVGTGIGFVVALISQVFIMWHYGLPSTFGQDIGITLFFTGISILRGYAVRRFFNWRHHEARK